MKALFALATVLVGLSGCGARPLSSCENHNGHPDAYRQVFSGIVVGVGTSDSEGSQRVAEQTFGAVDADEATGHLASVTVIPIVIHRGSRAGSREILVPVRSSSDRTPVVLEWMDVLGLEVGDYVLARYPVDVCEWRRATS